MSRVLSTSWRYGLSAVLGVGVTIGLGLMMRSVIAAEFVPQPTDRIRASLATYVEGPGCVIICIGHGETEQYIVFTPQPAPPDPSTRGKDIYRLFENPHDNRPLYVAPKPETSLPILDVSLDPISVDDGHCHGHILRVPPKFPPSFLKGDTSGFCKAFFVYDENGFAADIDIESCTHNSLESPTRKSIESWRGCTKPSTQRRRQSSTIRFDLVDKAGEVLPYP